MNNRSLLVVAVTLSALSVTPVVAQNVSGSWEISSEGRRGPQTMTFEFAQDGVELTGTVALSFGGRRGGGGGGRGVQTVEIADGMIDGNDFTFTLTLSFGDNSFVQTFSGTVDGDSMQGTIEGGRGGGRPFTGQRAG